MTAPNGTLQQTAPDVRGKRVLVYSLGMEGRDLARWLLANDASVTISDTRTDAALEVAGATAPDGVEKLVNGQPLLDPAGFDLVAVSQSVLRYNPALVRARELGIPVTSQMRLFLQLCPGRTIGITGSSGKSTTTALVGAMAREAGIESAVGGNIGEAMLARLGDIRPETTVILEISHTQLQYTDRKVRVLELRPELSRFAGKTGRVVTVNMNGRALVQFESPEDRSWYDLELSVLEVLPSDAFPSSGNTSR